jgi:hypothetical protein
MAITETCTCGATLSTSYLSVAADASVVERFREVHASCREAYAKRLVPASTTKGDGDGTS